MKSMLSIADGLRPSRQFVLGERDANRYRSLKMRKGFRLRIAVRGGPKPVTPRSIKKYATALTVCLLGLVGRA